MRKTLLLALTMLLLAMPGLAQDSGNITVIGGEEESLRRFIERDALPYPGTPIESVTVYIEALPPDLPFELLLPDDVEVIGSVVTEGVFSFTQIIADAAFADADAAYAFYEDNLGDSFTVANFPGGGFIGSSGPRNTYCYNGNEVAFSVEAIDFKDAVTLRLRINDQLREGDICNLAPEERQSDDLYQLLPGLTAPAGVRQLSGGSGSSSSGYADTRATLQGDDTSIAALFEHYNAQLEETGWELAAVDTNEEGGWSSWRFTANDTPYSGALMILTDPVDDNQYHAQLFIRRAE